MKIPESVRINGVEFKIEYVNDLNADGKMLYGQIDYDDCVIRLSGTAGTSHQMRCLTLLHEIMHGIVDANGMKVENEEKIVEMFARGIYQVLQDNGKRLFDTEDSNHTSHNKAFSPSEIQHAINSMCSEEHKYCALWYHGEPVDSPSAVLRVVAQLTQDYADIRATAHTDSSLAVAESNLLCALTAYWKERSKLEEDENNDAE